MAGEDDVVGIVQLGFEDQVTDGQRADDVGKLLCGDGDGAWLEDGGGKRSPDAKLHVVCGQEESLVTGFHKDIRQNRVQGL